MKTLNYIEPIQHLLKEIREMEFPKENIKDLSDLEPYEIKEQEKTVLYEEIAAEIEIRDVEIADNTIVRVSYPINIAFNKTSNIIIRNSRTNKQMNLEDQ